MCLLLILTSCGKKAGESVKDYLSAMRGSCVRIATNFDAYADSADSSPYVNDNTLLKEADNVESDGSASGDNSAENETGNNEPYDVSCNSPDNNGADGNASAGASEDNSSGNNTTGGGSANAVSGSNAGTNGISGNSSSGSGSTGNESNGNSGSSSGNTVAQATVTPSTGSSGSASSGSVQTQATATPIPEISAEEFQNIVRSKMFSCISSERGGTLLELAEGNLFAQIRAGQIVNNFSHSAEDIYSAALAAGIDKDLYDYYGLDMEVNDSAMVKSGDKYYSMMEAIVLVSSGNSLNAIGAESVGANLVRVLKASSGHWSYVGNASVYKYASIGVVVSGGTTYAAVEMWYEE